VFSGVLSATCREIPYRIKQLLAMPFTEALLCQFEVHYQMGVAAEQQFRFGPVKRPRRCCCGRWRDETWNYVAWRHTVTVPREVANGWHCVFGRLTSVRDHKAMRTHHDDDNARRSITLTILSETFDSHSSARGDEDK
jgi:hypothetical protein